LIILMHIFHILCIFDYKIGICCFSAKHAVMPVLRRKSKDGLALNQDNVSVWGDMSIRRLDELALYKLN